MNSLKLEETCDISPGERKREEKGEKSQASRGQTTGASPKHNRVGKISQSAPQPWVEMYRGIHLSRTVLDRRTYGRFWKVLAGARQKWSLWETKAATRNHIT